MSVSQYVSFVSIPSAEVPVTSQQDADTVARIMECTHGAASNDASSLLHILFNTLKNFWSRPGVQFARLFEVCLQSEACARPRSTHPVSRILGHRGQWIQGGDRPPSALRTARPRSSFDA
ncbi:hypothetical protein SCP_0200150 [Sparassis crispa]|uniref:Uncharacterized protein n=1 Tax=Sparassis crispa TaxID=139825 RepID=A0A401G9I0_9APHY|nr:hypothetical protein SCP_0200150 [Sparassis crispa]GBE78818.1 hypothetical protein SCP_0200150 [Sparassis crispa]